MAILTAPDPKTASISTEAKSEAHKIVPDIVWETLSAAEKEEKTQEYDTEFSNFNLGVLAGDIKMRSHLTAFAHLLSKSKKGKISYTFSSTQNENSLDLIYKGVIDTEEDIPFNIIIKLSKGSKIEITLGDLDTKKETVPLSMSVRDQITFLFDYAVSDIKDWSNHIDAIIAEKIKREDEECELD